MSRSGLTVSQSIVVFSLFEGISRDPCDVDGSSPKEVFHLFCLTTSPAWPCVSYRPIWTDFLPFSNVSPLLWIWLKIFCPRTGGPPVFSPHLRSPTISPSLYLFLSRDVSFVQWVCASSLFYLSTVVHVFLNSSSVLFRLHKGTWTSWQFPEVGSFLC